MGQEQLFLDVPMDRCEVRLPITISLPAPHAWFSTGRLGIVLGQNGFDVVKSSARPVVLSLRWSRWLWIMDKGPYL